MPAEKGVYLIIRDIAEHACFLEAGSGGHFNKRNPNVPIKVLEDAWVAPAQVLYIGKAGGKDKKATLRKRLNSYMRFGMGHPCSHWGGRYIWQLADAKELKVFWKATHDQEPDKLESELLREFRERYGKLPFANLRH